MHNSVRYGYDCVKCHIGGVYSTPLTGRSLNLRLITIICLAVADVNKHRKAMITLHSAHREVCYRQFTRQALARVTASDSPEK